MLDDKIGSALETVYGVGKVFQSFAMLESVKDFTSTYCLFQKESIPEWDVSDYSINIRVSYNFIIVTKVFDDIELVVDTLKALNTIGFERDTQSMPTFDKITPQSSEKGLNNQSFAEICIFTMLYPYELCG